MRAAALLLLALTAAASAPGFEPGLWEIRNEPGQASLDGKPLVELPLSPATSERVCMTAAEAAMPAKWLTRDNAGCTLTKTRTAGGRIDLAGTCPPPSDTAGPGSFSQTGRWSAGRFAIRFDSHVTGDNGTMGFTGTMTGRRVGACPA